MKDTDLAYLAGIIDGEGCIAIEKQFRIKGYTSPRYTMKVEIQMSEHPSIAYLSETFSRPIMVTRPAATKKLAYRLSWQSQLAKQLLVQLCLI